jgi:hypothetical protein
MSRAIEPFAVMLLWIGAWEIIYSDNPTINLIYVIVGYVGDLLLPEVFIWSIFFSCGIWAMMEPLHIHPLVALGISLPFVVWQDLWRWKYGRRVS